MKQWHKRHAITLAGSLPDNPEDALLVIEAMRDLVENFIRQKPPGQLPENVRPIRGAS
jgi:hypothetical protein